MGKIVSSGVLGRSRSYRNLLEFLAERSAGGAAPKELEIAMEVFGRDAHFDPGQDSMVRVYVHNLRQKIHQFYEGPGREETDRLVIPKGEYRVALAAPAAQAPDPETAPEPRPPRWRVRAAAAAAGFLVLGAGFALGWQLRDAPPGESRYESVAESRLWSPLFDDERPILVVVGDYYIFGELDRAGNVRRLVREFTVNSSRELDELVMFEPDLAGRYVDLDLTYLARSTAFALRDLLRVLYTSEKPVRMASMSELGAGDLKTNHVVYVGYISALDKLLDFVFASSRLAIGETYDELEKPESGERFVSEAGMPADPRNYRDYGLFSTFPGPSGNQFVIIAGTRDAGVMHSASAVTEPAYVAALEASVPEAAAGEPPAFELLYEVMGYDNTNLDARLVHSAPLDEGVIWGGGSAVALE